MARAATAKTKKGAYHHGDLRRALLDAALELIAREGTGAVALRELAQKVGVTHAAPYRHFRNKEALFATVAEEGFKLLTEAMVRERDAAGADTRARLLATGIGYIRFAVNHPAHFKVMFSHVGHPPADVPELAIEGATSFKVLVDAVAEAQAAGVVRPGDVLQQAVFAWSGVHGYSHLRIEQCLAPLGIEVDDEAQSKRVVADLLDGLGPR